MKKRAGQAGSRGGGCAAADVYWVSRDGKWMGFSKNVPVAANDSWNVILGEAHFVHGQ